ncbi:MAG: hypothetical protein M3Y21_02760 [Candidatus Eremiobacteraeota bacterium]|nr:hypothetical protein [Candidatus Eremiobacteraeota bacterium]
MIHIWKIGFENFGSNAQMADCQSSFETSETSEVLITSAMLDFRPCKKYFNRFTKNRQKSRGRPSVEAGQLAVMGRSPAEKEPIFIHLSTGGQATLLRP